LPNKHRKIFEVRSGSGDDAREIQKQIDAAAEDGFGAVHLPKGKYTLKQTVIVPAAKRIQIVGDGANEHGSVIQWRGQGTGPGLKLLGPSLATIRDLSLSFVSSGADALVVENCDQPGGRVFCDQIVCGGNERSKRCDVAVLIDGLEQSDVTFLNGGWGEFTRAGVLVKGGPLRQRGGKAPGQVSLLLGALGNNESRLIDVQDGGQVVACGYRDETPRAGALLDLGKDSSGKISIMGMSWAATPSTHQPFINVNDFSGTVVYVGNYIGSGYDENSGSFFFQIRGDGAKTQVLSAANEFTSLHSTNVSNVWRDTSNPAASASLVNSIGGGVNQRHYDIPNVVVKEIGSAPDEINILEALSQIRELRTEAPIAGANGLSDVRLIRILVRASEGRMGVILKR
jgi:hypothetical protein